MITVEWEVNQTCENCGENKPNCAQIDIEKTAPDTGVDIDVLLCSDCVADLIKRLS